MEEIAASVALEKVAVVPIAHPIWSKDSVRRGEIAEQQLNFNQRFIAVEEEDKERPENQSINLNHNDRKLVLNENMRINHSLNKEDDKPAAGQQKDYSLCMESNKKGCSQHEEMKIDG